MSILPGAVHNNYFQFIKKKTYMNRSIKMKERKKAIINLLILFLTFVINALGALGLINGYSQKEVSDRYLTLITPSPTTFSIWSIIYICNFIMYFNGN